jgi:hypothetical protein
LDRVRFLAEFAPQDGPVLAGGQSLVPMMNFRLARPAFLIDLNAGQHSGCITNPFCQFNQHFCRNWDQRFESTFLQRRVRKLSIPGCNVPLRFGLGGDFSASLAVMAQGTPAHPDPDPAFRRRRAIRLYGEFERGVYDALQS